MATAGPGKRVVPRLRQSKREQEAISRNLGTTLLLASVWYACPLLNYSSSLVGHPGYSHLKNISPNILEIYWNILEIYGNILESYWKILEIYWKYTGNSPPLQVPPGPGDRRCARFPRLRPRSGTPFNRIILCRVWAGNGTSVLALHSLRR